MSSDVDRLRRDVLVSDTASGFGVKLTKDGREWVACCPFHAEDTPSFKVFFGNDGIQRFHCFGCGERGDVLDFVQRIKGVDLREAVQILGGGQAGPNVAPRQIETRDVYDGIAPLDPPEEIAVGQRIALYNPKRAGTELEWGRFTATMVFPYRRVDGSLIGHVLRRGLRDGGKETPMVMWVRLPDGKERWSRFPFPKPRTLYGLETIGDAKQVLVVEGEKARDKLAAATHRTVVTWAGGTEGVKHADWSPLAGRNVVIWPDADKPGLATANEIAGIVAQLGATARIVDVPAGGADGAYAFEDWRSGAKAPKGWDAADAVDAGWSRDEIDGFVRALVRAWSPPAEIEKPAKVSPPVETAKPKTTVEARTVQQEQPQSATVTQLHTRKTVAADDSWQLGLVCNDKGAAKPGATKNWALLLEHHSEIMGTFAWDAFKLKTVLLRRPPWEQIRGSWEPRAIVDRDYSEAVMWLEARGMTPKATNIAPVIQTVAEHASFDRLREYLEGLKWDGKERVARFANDYLGCAGDNYAPIVSERWLISSVARGLKPGCKVDTMPILEGPQGLNKSTAVKALYGEEFFSDNLSDIGGKDAMMEMQGVWGLEVAEMHRFSQAETNAVKKFLSRDVDRYRPPYGRSVIAAPRRVVMVGTINPEGNAYLRDPTGARRFWPLTCGRIDIDKIKKDRDQLWAETVHLFRSGLPWWVQEDEEDTVKAEQEKRTDVDVWTALVAPMLKTRTMITQWEIFDALSIPKKETDYRHAGRIGRIMKKLGWEALRDRANGEDRVIFKGPSLEDAPKEEW